MENYDETFVQIVLHTTIRAYFTAVAYHKLNINHIDIKTAFVPSDMEEEVCIIYSQPEGYIIPNEKIKYVN